MFVLHIGLPKTATTFLQHQIFKRAMAPDGVFIHRRASDEAGSICQSFKALVRRSDEKVPDILATLVHLMNRLIDENVIVTDENISLDPDRFWEGTGVSPRRVAERLFAAQEALGTRFRLIIGTRRPDQWLASRYAQSSKTYADFSQSDFDQRAVSIARARRDETPFEWLDCPAVRSVFEELFGADHLFLYAMERLSEAPRDVLSEMGAFAGLDFLGCYEAAVRRHGDLVRNRLSTGVNTWRMFASDEHLVLKPEIQAAILDGFGERHGA